MHSISDQSDSANEAQTYLGIIFEKDSDGHYTLNALLYQDILLYFFEKRDNSYTEEYGPDVFVFNDLAGWLVMKKNREFTNFYSGKKAKTTKTSRINARRRRIQKCIDDVRDILIMEVSRVKARKNDEMTPLYWYTKYAKILAWLVRIVGKDEISIERRTADEEIYKLLQPAKSSEIKKTVRSLFSYRFFEMCWKNGIFTEIVSMLINVLHYGPKVWSMSRILDYIVYDYIRITNKFSIRKELWESFVEALDSLGETTKRMVIYREKLDIERRIYDINSSWEEVWFENRNEHSKLVLLLLCRNCGYNLPHVVDYYEFKREATLLEDGTFTAGGAKCTRCNTKGALSIRV
jgi:hypothetical protein